MTSLTSLQAGSDTFFLVDGTCWFFSSAPSRTEWLREFSRILGLHRDAPCPEKAATVHIVSPGERDAAIGGYSGTSTAGRTFEFGLLQVIPLPDGSTLHVIPDSATRRDRLLSMWYSLYPIYPRLLQGSDLPLHAGFATWEGRGVLFAAPGGTGKSTAMRRLPSTWTSLCDDESWLVGTQQGMFVHPMPTWSDLILRDEDRAWPTQEAVAVEAVVFLCQAEQVRIRRLAHAECSTLLKQSSEQILRRSWTILAPPDPPALRARLFSVAEQCARRLTGFLLELNLTDPFWPELELQLESSTKQ